MRIASRSGEVLDGGERKVGAFIVEDERGGGSTISFFSFELGAV
jgi:hypothetical protein